MSPIAKRYLEMPELFPWAELRDEDLEFPRRYLGSGFAWRKPDLVICYEDGSPYLFRWHVIERNYHGNVYFHIQTASDPERPLHTHPWDNQSAILAGDGYIELTQKYPPRGVINHLKRDVGDVIHRKASQAHRLILPQGGVGYSMTQFTTGRAIDKWGFWIGDTFYPHDEIVKTDELGRSFFHWPEGVDKEKYSDAR